MKVIKLSEEIVLIRYWMKWRVVYIHSVRPSGWWWLK